MTSTNPFVLLGQALETKAVAAYDDLVKFADAIEPIVATDIINAVDELASIAFNAVVAELPKVISGSEKFGNAVTNVVQTVETQGKTIGIQTAQAAVQQAFVTVQTVVKGS